MQKRKLGDLEVSALGLGCMGMSYGYGKPKDVKEMRELSQRLMMGALTFLILPKCMDPTSMRSL